MKNSRRKSRLDYRGAANKQTPTKNKKQANFYRTTAKKKIKKKKKKKNKKKEKQENVYSTAKKTQKNVSHNFCIRTSIIRKTNTLTEKMAKHIIRAHKRH